MIAFHFTADTLRNGEPIPEIGEWLEFPLTPIPCEQGLHASEHPFDALKFAPGLILHVVELEGELTSHGNPIDKWVGKRRKILHSLDTTFLLQFFARQQALSVAHLWNAPDVVLEYLLTADNRSAARSAAQSAARFAAWAAAWAAAAESAAWAAAAESAAQSAAWAAAQSAAWAADESAAAWAAAESAAQSAARDYFYELVKTAFNEDGFNLI